MGTWLLSGYEPGAGPIIGTVTMTANPAAPDEFTTDDDVQYTRTGRTVARTGRSVIYTGHQWRGRTTVNGDDKHVAARSDVRRSRLAVDHGPLVRRRLRRAWPRRDAHAHRPRARHRRSRSHGGSGAVAPRRPCASWREPPGRRGAHGRGLRPRRHSHARRRCHAHDVTVESTWLPMRRSARAISSLPARFEGRADGLRQDRLHQGDAGWGMARVGGVVFPKMLAQFEAFAFAHGTDGKPDTKDDMPIGAVDATWSVEEYTATFDDDDLKFVGESTPRAACSRRRWMVRTPRGPATATTSATSGWSPHTSPRRRRADARSRAPGGHRSAVPAVGLFSTVNGTMNHYVERAQPGDCHAFEAGGQRFLYLAPSAAVMAVMMCRRPCSTRIATRARTSEEIVADLARALHGGRSGRNAR